MSIDILDVRGSASQLSLSNSSYSFAFSHNSHTSYYITLFMNCSILLCLLKELIQRLQFYPYCQNLDHNIWYHSKIYQSILVISCHAQVVQQYACGLSSMCVVELSIMHMQGEYLLCMHSDRDCLSALDNAIKFPPVISLRNTNYYSYRIKILCSF